MREEKQLLLDELKEHVEAAPALLMTQYQGMNPNLAYELRNAVSESGGFFCVVKKRVFLKAAAEAGLTLDRESLKGHIGIVCTGDDTVATTKAVYAFKKGNKETLEVLGGRFEGKLCSPEEVEEISKLPSQDQMRSELLGTLEAPMSQTAAVIEALLTSPLFCLENKVEKEQASGE